MSQKQNIKTTNDVKEKSTTKKVVPEFRQGVCASAYVELLQKKNDSQINRILQHAKTTDSHAC